MVGMQRLAAGLSAAVFMVMVCGVARAQKPANRKPPFSLNWKAFVTPRTAIALSPLPPKQWKALAAAVGQQGASGAGPKTARQERALAPSATVSFQRLSRSGQPAALVSGPRADCGATGNCPLMIFRSSGTRWVPLLADGQGQGFIPQPTRSHGLRDIATEMTGGATESQDVLYRFDGHKYRRAGCWYVTYPTHGKGPPHFGPCL